MTGVTSDVGVPSTHLVLLHCPHYHNRWGGVLIWEVVFSEKFQCHHDCVLTCRFTTAVCGKFSPRWLRIWRLTSTSTSKDGWILCQTSLHHVWTTRHGHDSSSYSHPKVGTSNGSWCIGIKGEMSGTVCVTFTWDIYIYELFIAFVCFVVCSLL